MQIKPHLALIGFQACGKTTWGKQLASFFQCPFTDIDALIQTFHPSLSCREIFQTFGREHFRHLEQRVVKELERNLRGRGIIATGGGTLICEKNALSLKQHSYLIYLKTSLPVLRERILKKESLPAYFEQKEPEKALQDLYAERTVLYEQWADITLEMESMDLQKMKAALACYRMEKSNNGF